MSPKGKGVNKRYASKPRTKKSNIKKIKKFSKIKKKKQLGGYSGY